MKVAKTVKMVEGPCYLNACLQYTFDAETSMGGTGTLGYYLFPEIKEAESKFL